jgi:aldehyde dehydrogenase (NAD+)
MKNIKNLVTKQAQYFNSKETLPYQFRLEALQRLKEAILNNEEKLLNALQKDLNKSHHEGYITEVGIVLKEISYIEKRLKNLMKRKPVRTAITDFPAKSFIMPHPFGNVLIISPWNYPVNLTLTPLVGAIAAGNTAIIKPSEFSIHTSDVIEEIISSTFNEEYVAVVNGGIEVNQELLDHKFNYIFFTGSTNVGKIVMEKAAKHLTPVSLELGGKSPVIVDKTANIKVAAKRIAFGKFLNAGQTCIAPDYLLIDENVKDNFVIELQKAIEEYYGTTPLTSDQFGSIINKRHFDRLKSYLEDGEVIYGGLADATSRKISPTLIIPENTNMSVMQDEIFGPILPIITYKKIEEAIDFINNRSHPLAFYLFTENKQVENKFLLECQFGGGCINDTIVHIASDYLPFGGVGDSGMGTYHGTSTFKTFSHYKSVLKKSTKFDLKIRYAPYTDSKTNIIKKFLK